MLRVDRSGGGRRDTAESRENKEEERIEGEEGRVETLEPPKSRTRSQRKKDEETRK